MEHTFLQDGSFHYNTSFPEVNNVSDPPMKLMKWVPSPRDSTLLRHPNILGTLTLLYMATMLMIRRLLGGKRASFAKTTTFAYASALHDALLCIASNWMHVIALKRMVEVWQQHGTIATFCQGGRRFDDVLHIFLASKVWEFVDTVILSLRGCPLSFLHLWHRSSVVWQVRAWIEDDVSLAIRGMWVNTGVHVVMYA